MGIAKLVKLHKAGGFMPSVVSVMIVVKDDNGAPMSTLGYRVSLIKDGKRVVVTVKYKSEVKGAFLELRKEFS